MTDPIEEVRQRRAEQKARQARGVGMGDGWTEAHIDALLAEIDKWRGWARTWKTECDIACQQRNEEAAKRIELEAELARLRAAPAMPITEQEVEIRAYVKCYDQPGESIEMYYLRRVLKLLDEARVAPAMPTAGALFDVLDGKPVDYPQVDMEGLVEGLASPAADALKIAHELLFRHEGNRVWIVGKESINEVARALTKYGDQRAREARATALDVAIRFIESGRFLSDDAPVKQFANEVVAGLRRHFGGLAGTPPQSEGGEG